MIECKDILSLCDRFEAYLMPLDIHILCQRYNRKTLKSTYAVGREMGLSDETMRPIENRALAALDHCLDVEADGQAITSMQLAKARKQPMADEICTGRHPTVPAAAWTAPRGRRIVVASSRPLEPGGEHIPRGVVVGRVLRVDGACGPVPHPHDHQWSLVFEPPEIFPKPMPSAGQPSYCYMSQDTAT
jgi:hypothetical protein